MQDGTVSASTLPPVAIASPPTSLWLLDEVDLRFGAQATTPCEVCRGSPLALEDDELAGEQDVIGAESVATFGAPKALENDPRRVLQSSSHSV